MLGPHQAIKACNERERFALEFARPVVGPIPPASLLRGDLREHRPGGKARFFNDHIAFRTFANQRPMTGIASLSRLFEALDYRPAGVYHFPDKHLTQFITNIRIRSFPSCSYRN